MSICSIEPLVTITNSLLTYLFHYKKDFATTIEIIISIVVKNEFHYEYHFITTIETQPIL